jgi:hypothetical protein
MTQPPARRSAKGDAVRRELLPGESPALLKELHLLTRNGDLNADALRKLKQVNHLIGLVAPAIEDVLARFGDPVIVDCGAGKGYLGFILYELFLKNAGKGTLVSIESRPELVRDAEARAKRLGFDRMRFVASAIEGAALPERIHLLTALHACDTATDDALALAIKHNADHVAVVPCCQAELAAQMKARKEASPPIAWLVEHPIHRRELGSHLTNVLRALTLESRGFSVTVTELTGWEHSLKNELILAKRVRGSFADAQKKLDALLAAAGVSPKLQRLLSKESPGAGSL